MLSIDRFISFHLVLDEIWRDIILFKSHLLLRPLALETVQVGPGAAPDEPMRPAPCKPQVHSRPSGSVHHHKASQNSAM